MCLAPTLQPQQRVAEMAAILVNGLFCASLRQCLVETAAARSAPPLFSVARETSKDEYFDLADGARTIVMACVRIWNDVLCHITSGL